MDDVTQDSTDRGRGISLVEALIVLSIFAILVAAIWSVSATAYRDNKNRQLVEQTVQLINNVKTLYQGQTPSTDGFSLNSAIVAGVFPPGMVVQTAPPEIRHAWAQTNSIDISNPGAGLMVLTIDNVPSSACVLLVSRLGGSTEVAQRYGLISIAVNEQTLVPSERPVSPGDAASSCGENNTVNLLPWFGIATAYAKVVTNEDATQDASSLVSNATTHEPNLEKMGIIFAVP